MKYILEFVKSDVGKILLSILGVFLILGVLYSVFYPSEEERLQAAQADINVLFENQENNVLKAEVTQEEIQQAENSVNKLPHDKKEELNTIISKAQSQFDVLTVISPVFEGNPLIGETELLVKEGVTSDLITQTQNSLPKEDNEYVTKAKNLLDEVPTLIQEMEALRSEMGTFTEIKTVTRSNLYDVVLIANELTDKVTQFTNQPYMAKTYEIYNQSLDNLVNAIINGHSYGHYEQLLLDAIFSNPVLSERLKGTPLNPSPQIALTFDDGPNTEFTPQILEILAENDVKATFFVYGAYVDENPEMAKRIVDEGHIIANHSYSHPDFSQIPDEEIIQEIEWAQDSIVEATGYEPTLYRMPFGAGGPRAVRLFPDMTSILWNVDSLDWQLQDAELIYQNIMSNLSSDMLVLMHDTAQYTVDAVARFVPELIEQGYVFVSPMELEFQHRYFDE
ncbi:polysaccharide deacetylase family protein [Aerococcaceae bacterium DSM 111021]|nr:polysaccharide deacetylase family protein [Aerococcaceae bacterium DSM 111021]